MCRTVSGDSERVDHSPKVTQQQVQLGLGPRKQGLITLPADVGLPCLRCKRGAVTCQGSGEGGWGRT